MRKIVILFSIILSSYIINAQQFGLNNFYLYNKMLFDASAVTLEPGVHGFVDYRDQWTGYKNAPETGILGFKAMYKNTGWGASMMYERAGLFRTFSLTGYSGYRILLKNNNHLHLGANLSVKQNILQLEEIDNADINDPAIGSNKFFETILQAGAAVSFSNKYLELALSVPDIYSTVTNAFLQNVFFFGSYQIGQENFYKHSYIKPFIIFHYSKPQVYLLNVGVEVKFNQYLLGALSLRSNMSAIGSVMIKISDFYFGYAYEANLEYSKYLGLSTHEICIRFSDPYFFK